MTNTKKKKLSDLQKESKASIDAARFLSELSSGSDRACALIGGAVVDDALERAISARFVNDRQVRETVFKAESGALGAFGKKIHVARALGIIGPIAYEDVKIIKNIRNTFAHAKVDFDFSHEAVVTECNKLQPKPKRGPDEPPRVRNSTKHYNSVTTSGFTHHTITPARSRFIDSVVMLWFGLASAASPGREPEVNRHLP